MRNTATIAHLNRTGMSVAPALSAELVEGTASTEPSAAGDAQLLADVRIQYARDAEPIGSVPPPATAGGAAKLAVKAVMGDKMLVLVDKLGERLAFERSGTRLYDGLISKFDAYGSWEGGPSRADLEQIRGEEHQHFTLLVDTIRALGGDPTAVTPSANLHAVASKGLCAVISDPRTDLMQSMEAILTAELVDNDCWENLIDLSRALGRDDVAAEFDGALAQEREHLVKVRHWLGVALSRAATRKVDPAFAARDEERTRRTGGARAASDDEAEPTARAAKARARTATKRPAASAKGRGSAKPQAKASGRSAPKRGAKKAPAQRR